MSQYPSPYQPPTFDYRSYMPAAPDLLAPARRAGTMMFVIGGLILLLGGCIAAMSRALPGLPMQAEQEQVMTNLEQTTHLARETFFAIVGIAIMVPGALMIFLGFFVRRGGLWSSVLSIILTVLLLLWFVLNVVGGIATGSGNPAGMMCFGLIAVAALGPLLAAQFAAARAAPKITVASQQYAMQYYQYMQNMQAYQAAQTQQQPTYPPMDPPPPPPPAQ